MAVSPNADIKLVYSVDTATGRLKVDFALTPSGDLALVTGPAKLQQDIIRWLVTPEGANPLDPTFGNPLFALLGQPSSNNTTIVIAMIESAESAFIQRQQAAAADGFLALDEQVDHFDDLEVNYGGSANPNGVQLPVGTVHISFTIVTRAGTSHTTALPMSLSFAA